jgi:hypothetical protein
MRRCQDGSLHKGKLELVTWDTPENPNENYGEAMGWGAVVEDEAEVLKQKFEVRFGLSFWCVTGFRNHRCSSRL